MGACRLRKKGKKAQQDGGEEEEGGRVAASLLHIDGYTATVRSVQPNNKGGKRGVTRDGDSLKAAAAQVLARGGSVERALLVSQSAQKASHSENCPQDA